jgi:hypothetical protein
LSHFTLPEFSGDRLHLAPADEALMMNPPVLVLPANVRIACANLATSREQVPKHRVAKAGVEGSNPFLAP